jgi:uroporphyrinogen-III synthase
MTAKHVLVTRPRSQAVALCALLRARGFTVTQVPVMEITPLAAPQQIAQITAVFSRIASIDALVFVSVNAAEMALPWLTKFPPPQTTHFFAIGKTTAQFFDERWHSTPCSRADAHSNGNPGTTIYPHQEMNSEGLLALPELRAAQVQGKHFLILRGEGGRELIAETLTARGAQVDSISLYRRFVPQENAEALRYALPQADIVLVNSGESLDNLLALSASSRDALLAKTLVLPGQRVARYAQELGFKHILVAENATDEAMVEALG